MNIALTLYNLAIRGRIAERMHPLFCLENELN